MPGRWGPAGPGEHAREVAMSRRSVRRSAIGALSGAAIAVLLLALGGSAQGRGDPPCPAGALCVWEHSDFDGKRVVVTGTGISNEIAEKMDDEVSSVFNRRGKASRLYARKNANGDTFCVSPQAEIPFVGGEFNDVASSSKLTKKPGCPF